MTDESISGGYTHELTPEEFNRRDAVRRANDEGEIASLMWFWRYIAEDRPASRKLAELLVSYRDVKAQQGSHAGACVFAMEIVDNLLELADRITA